MRRRDLTLIIVILAILVPAALFSQDLEAEGYSLLSTRQKGDETIYEVRDREGSIITIQSGTPLTRETVGLLKTLHDDFYTWNDMRVDTMSLIISEETAEISVVPSSYEYGGVDLTAYMPSGMQFYYDGFLEYDFRLKVDTLFLRVRGRYEGERELSEKLVSATGDPYTYIQSYDQEFFIRKFMEMDVKAEQFESALGTLGSDLEELTSRAYAAYEFLREDNERLEEAGIILRDRLFALEDDHEALARAHQELQDEVKTLEDMVRQMGEDLSGQHLALADEFALLKQAVITLHNKGLFGKGKPIAASARDRLIEMKKADPSLSQEEAMARLKEEEITMTKREISLVFAVYFNEFE